VCRIGPDPSPRREGGGGRATKIVSPESALALCKGGWCLSTSQGAEAPRLPFRALEGKGPRIPEGGGGGGSCKAQGVSSPARRESDCLGNRAWGKARTHNNQRRGGGRLPETALGLKDPTHPDIKKRTRNDDTASQVKQERGGRPRDLRRGKKNGDDIRPPNLRPPSAHRKSSSAIISNKGRRRRVLSDRGDHYSCRNDAALMACFYVGGGKKRREEVLNRRPEESQRRDLSRGSTSGRQEKGKSKAGPLQSALGIQDSLKSSKGGGGGIAGKETGALIPRSGGRNRSLFRREGKGESGESSDRVRNVLPEDTVPKGGKRHEPSLSEKEGERMWPQPPSRGRKGAFGRPTAESGPWIKKKRDLLVASKAGRARESRRHCGRSSQKVHSSRKKKGKSRRREELVLGPLRVVHRKEKRGARSRHEPQETSGGD